MDSDGFIPVRYSKRLKRKYLPLPNADKSKNLSDGYDPSINYSREAAIKKVKVATQTVNKSEYFADFWDGLSKSVTCDLQKPLEEISKIVCYGLGSLCRTTKSIEQFALLINLQNKLNIPMELYDPIFTDNDKSIIAEEFNYEVLQVNEEGRRTASDLTVFYLPHCPHILCNNLIFTNWDPLTLKNCIIIANGFSLVIDNNPNTKKPPFNYIRKANSLVVELSLRNTYVPMDAFNDFSIHVFPSQAYDLVDVSIWDKSETPDDEREEYGEMICGKNTRRF